jgi:hypothetical protein
MSHDVQLRVLAPKARWKQRGLRAADILKSFTLTFSPDVALTAGLEPHRSVTAGDETEHNSLQASYFGQQWSVTCCACLPLILGAGTSRTYLLDGALWWSYRWRPVENPHAFLRTHGGHAL